MRPASYKYRPYTTLEYTNKRSLLTNVHVSMVSLDSDQVISNERTESVVINEER